ncbi:hypothetical protein BCR41DRAFT_233691 [Lobosporangium transversale]|uniref:Uncharacterized protein n=1 Tax=Lobosporangium transversale TaxID=64571 RepID=A0A1Y2GUP6_9FUNG|nr:hypothetical protein BCR41DRAFT_233691 [Lobosporangium transversale]ORZ24792.1 hypothetical protein BCR41DRAFT_233691 [Lobosporangium transversale]|eukprot:XP_021883773.1 hypothetical protein BCR41DRAFT_233691 [Lobosporangium transversale]
MKGRKGLIVLAKLLPDYDWFLVESIKDWNENELSTEVLNESRSRLFEELHLIAIRRSKETNSDSFMDIARFFSIYSGGD